VGRVLHISSENFAGVPYSVVRAERLAGVDSHIVTLMPSPYGHPQEDSLNLPLFSGGIVSKIRTLVGSSAPIDNVRYRGEQIPPVWNPSPVGKILFALRDFLWDFKVKNSRWVRELDSYDALALDGGIGFLRSGKYVLGWAKKHGCLITIYYGSDLRKRGVIPRIDSAARYVFTFEFDHTLIHPGAKFMFYPFFADDMPPRRMRDDGKVRIGHSPTRRSTKGTDVILTVLERLREKFPQVEIVLIEGLPYQKALELKSEIDIFIDQLSELGYGVSSLEALAMGIPVVCQILPDFERFLGEHPFVNADERTLENVLIQLVKSEDMRIDYGERGREWVRRVHSPVDAIEPLLGVYRKEGLL